VASLDPRAAEDVMDLLRARADAAGATFVFTTHNLDHARRHADRLVALKEGRLAFDAATASVSDSLLGALYEGA
jgi:phosphonate transport system ATP-binding protein